MSDIYTDFREKVVITLDNGEKVVLEVHAWGLEIIPSDDDLRLRTYRILPGGSVYVEMLRETQLPLGLGDD